MNIKFISDEENPPLSKDHGKFTIEEHAVIQEKFAKFMAGKGPAQPMNKPRCHIITCYVGRDGLTCYYHCRKNE